MELLIYTDGASRGNPGPSSIGIIIKDDKFRKVKEIAQYIGISTNNFAEYFAVLTALKQAQEMRVDKVSLFVDSELIARQLSGKYKVKSKNLRPLFNEIIAITKNFSAFSINHINRDQNVEADMLANLALNKNQENLDNKVEFD